MCCGNKKKKHLQKKNLHFQPKRPSVEHEDSPMFRTIHKVTKNRSSESESTLEGSLDEIETSRLPSTIAPPTVDLQASKFHRKLPSQSLHQIKITVKDPVVQLQSVDSTRLRLMGLLKSNAQLNRLKCDELAKMARNDSSVNTIMNKLNLKVIRTSQAKQQQVKNQNSAPMPSNTKQKRNATTSAITKAGAAITTKTSINANILKKINQEIDARNDNKQSNTTICAKEFKNGNKKQTNDKDKDDPKKQKKKKDS